MTDVFISYSTKNLAFVQLLEDDLTSRGLSVWLDQKRNQLEGIPRGTKWWSEIKHGITRATTFLFVISPHAVVSPYCNAEIAHALAEEKRIVTVLYCDDQSVRAALESINVAIDAIDPAATLPATVTAEIPEMRKLIERNWLKISGIQFVVAYHDDPMPRVGLQVKDAIDLDIEWIRALNKLYSNAREWRDAGRDPAFIWPDERLAPIRHEIEQRGETVPDYVLEFIRPEATRLLEELQQKPLDHQQRREIGIRLSHLGDPRDGVDINPTLKYPEIAWCRVDDTLFMAKYPITVAQFQAFVDDAQGFNNAQSWRTVEPRYRMQPLKDQLESHRNYPRTFISWYQAQAFCTWLNDRLIDITLPTAVLTTQSAGWSFRLPTLSEWQHIWRSLNSGMANTKQSGLGKSVAVGLYEGDQTSQQIYDVRGNVSEWCLSHNRMISTSSFYTNQQAAFCGGSFEMNANDVECPVSEAIASSRMDHVGFRVALTTRVATDVNR